MQIVSSKAKSDRQTATEDPIARIRRLLRRKRSEKDRLERDIRALAAEVLGVVTRQTEVLDLHGEIHALFRQALKRPIPRKGRVAVYQLYQSLVEDGVLFPEVGADDEPDLSPDLSPDPASDDDRWQEEDACPCPFCEAARESSKRSSGQGGGSPGARDAGGDAEHRGAGNTDGRSRLRDLYHDLALRFHPDLADDDQREHHEAIMRDVNSAYREGDTDRLLELARELGLELDEIRQADGMLAELVGQYERLKWEVREMRNSEPGQMVVDTRRARRRGTPTPMEELGAVLEEALESAREVRDLVGRFVAGELSWKELVAEEAW